MNELPTHNELTERTHVCSTHTRTDDELDSAAHRHDNAGFIPGSQRCRLLIGIGEQHLFLLRLVAVPHKVAANIAVEAPLDRRLQFWSSLLLGRREELVIALFPASLTAPPGTLASPGTLRD
jgi:hypothetical protein